MISPRAWCGRVRREDVIVALLASAFAAVIVIQGATGPLAPNDFFKEAAPSYLALSHGHLLRFLQLAPLYGGSLELRAPFALMPALWGGSLRAIYAASALPCVFALVGYAVWVARQPRRGGHSWAARLVSVGVCVCTPYVFVVLHGGHPEELLGAVLCIAAVLAAANGRATLAGLLVGLAVANKQWAALAVPVVVAVLPAGRWRALLIAGASASVLLVPVVLGRQDHLVSSSAVSTGSMFLPPQLLWWLGNKPWIAGWAHPLIVAIGPGLAMLWYRARSVPGLPPARRAQEGLLLLALLFLLRSALDPWNNVTYAIPFLFALLACEARVGRPPLLTLACGTAFWIVMQALFGQTPDDLRAALYAAVTVPMLAVLGARVFVPRATVVLGRLAIRRPRPRLQPQPAALLEEAA